MNSGAQEIMQVLNIPIEDIIPNRFQPRLNFDEEGLKELANSIKEHGIIQPLVVRRLAEKYEIIAGERRYKAAKIAGLTQVPAIITNMDDQKSAEAAVVENIQRRDLSAIEEAKSYQSLLEKDDITQEQLAKKMGLSQSAISNKLRLLTLSENVQNALIEGKISERHARSLLQIEDKSEQDEWLNKIIDDRLTVRELDKQIKSKFKGTIPLVNNDINLDVIKATATDINVENNIETSSEKVRPLEEPKKMPNKFFNFLEDEAISMGTEEDDNDNDNSNNNLSFDIPIINQTINNDNSLSIDDKNGSAPESMQVEKNDEIEMLDFVAPTIEKEITLNVNDKQSDVDSLFNSLIDDLKKKNYDALLTKENNGDNTIYIISVNDKNNNY